MSRISQGFISAFLMLLPLSVSAQTTPATAPAPAPVAAPALYQLATKHLAEGHWFEDAARQLADAVRQDPANSAYHLALGCALADRAGSLAYAASMTDTLEKEQAKYPRELADWKAEQRDPDNSYKDVPPPLHYPSRRFKTKDDLLYLRLTVPQAVARIIVLGRAAQAEWKQAVALAKAPLERAEAEYVQGWGLSLELRWIDLSKYDASKISGVPKQTDVIAAFEATTKDAPQNASYFESLGDAYFDNSEKDPRALAAYAQSLQLKPRNPELLYRVCRMQRTSDPTAALETLKQAAASDSGNAFPQYMLAEIEFSQIHYDQILGSVPSKRDATTASIIAKETDQTRQTAQDALTALERGNADSEYRAPKYVPPVPKILAVAWNYWDWMAYDNLDMGDMALLRNLARSASGYAEIARRQNDEATAVRASQDCIRTGERLMGNWPVRDSSPDSGDVIRVLVGDAVIGIGSRELQKIYEQAGDTALAQQVASERAALQQQIKAYSAVMLHNLFSDNMFDNY